MPDKKTIIMVLLLGFIAYGLSIFAYIKAQKTLGASKTSAYYAVAPFIGVALSFIFLNEKVSIAFVLALFIMIAGTVLIVYDTMFHSHSHMHTHVVTHTHEGTTHTHVIVHSHEHSHVIREEKHGHEHKMSEFEIYLNH